ncbi:CoA pyrophosphatase [Rhodopila sp.]|uniref:CoA pyrophosphatase n=1 Tax=Rhodopila sp. TaxID=2480087 RepID=UPI003D143CC4
MTPDELRLRLTEIVAQPQVAQPQVADPILGDEVANDLERPPVPAAVLVGVVLGEQPSVLLTKRTSHLTRHPGQISFPGGRIDPEDNGPEAAALREAREEIGLDAGSVEVLGRLTDHVTGTGYRITPVLAVVPPALTYQLSPHEVDAIFELPMHVVLDPASPRRQRQHVGGIWREYWVWPHPEHFIWGATAAILLQLAQRLRERTRLHQGVT